MKKKKTFFVNCYFHKKRTKIESCSELNMLVFFLPDKRECPGLFFVRAVTFLCAPESRQQVDQTLRPKSLKAAFGSLQKGKLKPQQKQQARFLKTNRLVIVPFHRKSVDYFDGKDRCTNSHTRLFSSVGQYELRNACGLTLRMFGLPRKHFTNN